LRESEQKLQQQQEELRQTNKELSQQIQELVKQQATEHQKNLALEKAQQLIEEKVKTLEQSSKHQFDLSDNMTQQLQLPLNNLQALLKLLDEHRNANLTEKQIEFAHTMDKTVTEVLTPVNNVVEPSNVKSDKTQVRLEEVYLKGLADYIEQNFTRMAVERGLYLKVDIAKGLPDSIHTDRQRVEQIVQNLLSNALKFTDQGGLKVRFDRPAAGAVFSQSGLALHNTIAFSVADTGIGFSEEKRRAISRAFQGTDASVGQSSNGMGTAQSGRQGEHVYPFSP
jgi:signal transduction histidine kinase